MSAHRPAADDRRHTFARSRPQIVNGADPERTYVDFVDAVEFGGTPGAVSDATDAVMGVANDAASRVADMAATTRAAFEDANRRIGAGTDEMLMVGTAMSFGLAVGLLIGGASRILVATALVPVAMMGMTMLDRSSGGRAAAGGLQGP